LTKHQRLIQLEERREQLLLQQRRLRAELRREERKQDTRRKILAGAWLLEQAEGDFGRLAMKLDEWLTRDADRALFGLAPVPNEKDSLPDQ